MSGKTIKVRDLMTTDLVTIGMDDTIRVAQRIFNEKRFHHLIVVEGGQTLGVVSDRDLLKHLSPFVGVRYSERAQDTETPKKRMHQVMTRKLISIDPDAFVHDAARTMMHHHVSCLPVIDAAGTLVGIITTRDVLRWAVRHLIDHDASG